MIASSTCSAVDPSPARCFVASSSSSPCSPVRFSQASAAPLVLDVVAGNAGLDETADQVAHVRVTAVAGVGVGDDERPEVDGRRGAPAARRSCASAYCWLRSAVKQRAHEGRRLVGHLAQRVARQIGPGILGHGALGRGGPAAEVDPSIPSRFIATACPGE